MAKYKIVPAEVPATSDTRGKLCSNKLSRVSEASGLSYQKSGRSGFTLAEVLVTVAIIGVVAAITITSAVNNSRQSIYKRQYQKAYNTVSRALVKAYSDMGYTPKCFYWDDDAHPYSKDYKSGGCVSFTASGECASGGWVTIDKKTGKTVPNFPDWNGQDSDCSKLAVALRQNLKIIKTCKGNAFKNGCLPDYNGNDTVFAANNKKAGNSEYTTVELNQKTAGCSGFRKDNILKINNAYVLADGTILFAYSNGWDLSKLFGVDINGKKAPNKWGYDIFSFMLKGTAKTGPKLRPGSCYNLEKGGVGGTQMWKDMNK